jgi:hypothetical protein
MSSSQRVADAVRDEQIFAPTTVQSRSLDEHLLSAQTSSFAEVV